MNKKFTTMKNHTCRRKTAKSFAFFVAMFFSQFAFAQEPGVTVRLANPTYSCENNQYCLDVEFISDVTDVQVFGMNVRFFYDDAMMELDSFADYQGGYGAVSPNPPTVLSSPPGFGTNFFGFPAPGVADWVNGAIQLVDLGAPPIILDTADWTKLFQICFTVETPFPDSSNFCPPVVWDLELNPANGGYLAGDDGVVITVVEMPPAMSGPSAESVDQFNWMYVGDGSAPPYGQPIEEACISLFCIPDITCPADVTLNCDDPTDPANTGFATATSTCIDSLTITFSDQVDSLSGNCTQELNILRTWIAFNDCGYADTCVQTISLIDTVGPVLICPADITIECDESTDPSNTGTAFATDNCDPSPIVTYIDVPVAGDCPQEYTIDRIWFGSDACGNNNFALCRQRITIIDETPPTIVCPPDMTLECSDPLPTDVPAATDNCSTALTYTYTDVLCENPIMGFTGLYDIANWDTIALNGGEVTPMGDMQVMLEGPDGTIPCPNGASVLFQIVIPSTGQLVFDWDYQSFDVDGTFFDPFGYNLNGTFYQLTQDDGPLTQSGTTTVQVTAGDVFAFEQRSVDCILGQGASTVVEFFACVEQMEPVCTQLIIRQHTVADECGNEANCIQTFYLEDTTPPVITCPANLTIECDANTLPDNTGMAVATDNCDTDIVITYSDTSLPLMTCPQEYVISRVWTATDNCGNSSTCNQTIIVDDSTPPVFTFCPADITVECDASTDPADTGGFASATDNCDTEATITYDDLITPSTTCPQEYSITRTWVATDDCGNTSTCVQMVTVDDSTPPVITLCPADVTIECDESTLPANTGLATATDNCDTAPTITYNDNIVPGACPQEYVMTRTWVATDDCGNTSTCNQLITVEDTTPPVIVFCPEDVTIECDVDPNPENTGIASATDNCDTAPVVTYNDATEPGACPQESTITRTWTATDACGNSTTCVQVITVDDSTPPVIVCPTDL